MRFIDYIQEAKQKLPRDKSKSALVNKVGNALKKILPIVDYENNPFRLGLGVYAGDLKSDYGSNPITCPGYEGATGIAIFIDEGEKIATVYEITAAIKGMGSKMIEAMLSALPKDYAIAIHHDWSGGWWSKIMEKYSDRKWIVS